VPVCIETFIFTVDLPVLLLLCQYKKFKVFDLEVQWVQENVFAKACAEWEQITGVRQSKKRQSPRIISTPNHLKLTFYHQHTIMWITSMNCLSEATWLHCAARCWTLEKHYSPNEASVLIDNSSCFFCHPAYACLDLLFMDNRRLRDIPKWLVH